MFSQGSKLHIYLINFLSIWNNRIKEFSYFYQKVLKPPRILLSLLIFLILFSVSIESLALAQNVTVNNPVTVNQTFDLNQTVVGKSNCTYIEEKNNTEESNSTTEIVDNSTTENASEPNSTIIVNTSVTTTVSEPTSTVTITSIETTIQITSETTSTVVTSTLNPTLTSDSTKTVITATKSPQTTTQQLTTVSTTSTSATTIQLENTKIQLVPRVNDEVKDNYRIGDVVNFTIILDVAGQDIYLDTNISGWNIVKGTDSILFNTTSFNESGVYNITGFFNASIGSGYQSSFVTYYATVSGYPANYTDFDDPETTDFNSAPDIENVSQPTIAKTNTAKVTWNGFINASGTDFDQNIIYTNNNVTILSQNLNNTFDSSANITMYYLNYTETPVIYRDGELCLSDCSVINYDSQNLTFNVTHFTSYTTGENSKLTIWDLNDTEGGGKSIYTDQNATFFANYTNTTDGKSINGTGVYCNISFNVTGTWAEWKNMTFNQTSLLYEYNRSFDTSETLEWNVSCYGSSLDHEVLNTTDNITILPGYLEVELIYPPISLLMAKHSNITVNGTIYCRGGSCGNVQGTVRYNSTSDDPDVAISTLVGTEPFYIQESNPLSVRSCSNNPLTKDEYCNITWIINASGDSDTGWEVGILFNSTNNQVLDNHTSNSTISIIECFNDIAVNWDYIDFGNMMPNTNENSASGNPGKDYNISSYEWSCNLDIWINGTDFENTTYNSVIGVGNMTWNRTGDVSSTILTHDYDLIQSDLARNTNLTTYYWFNLPPAYKGKYDGRISIKTNDTE